MWEAATLALEPKKSKQPGNKINPLARKQMRQKTSKTKRIMKSKCPKTILRLRDEINVLDQELKKSYEKRNRIEEEKILPQLFNNPNLFYSYAKGFATTTTAIV